MADAYEREHMQGVGAVLHRQKVQAPAWSLALVAWLPGVVVGALAIAHGVDLTLPAIGGLAYGVAMSGLLLAVAGGRLAVSEGELHVQIGPFGPRIPIDAITDCDVGPSGIRSYGLGAQKLLDGTTVYKMLGDNAQAARITTSDGRRLVIVCPDAPTLVAALREAMRRRRGLPRARVAVPAADLDTAADDEVARAARDDEAAR